MGAKAIVITTPYQLSFDYQSMADAVAQELEAVKRLVWYIQGIALSNRTPYYYFLLTYYCCSIVDEIVLEALSEGVNVDQIIPGSCHPTNFP